MAETRFSVGDRATAEEVLGSNLERGSQGKVILPPVYISEGFKWQLFGPDGSARKNTLHVSEENVRNYYYQAVEPARGVKEGEAKEGKEEKPSEETTEVSEAKEETPSGTKEKISKEELKAKEYALSAIDVVNSYRNLFSMLTGKTLDQSKELAEYYEFAKNNYGAGAAKFVVNNLASALIPSVLAKNQEILAEFQEVETLQDFLEKVVEHQSKISASLETAFISKFGFDSGTARKFVSGVFATLKGIRDYSVDYVLLNNGKVDEKKQGVYGGILEAFLAAKKLTDTLKKVDADKELDEALKESIKNSIIDTVSSIFSAEEVEETAERLEHTIAEEQKEKEVPLKKEEAPKTNEFVSELVDGTAETIENWLSDGRGERFVRPLLKSMFVSSVIQGDKQTTRVTTSSLNNTISIGFIGLKENKKELFEKISDIADKVGKPFSPPDVVKEVLNDYNKIDGSVEDLLSGYVNAIAKDFDHLIFDGDSLSESDLKNLVKNLDANYRKSLAVLFAIDKGKEIDSVWTEDDLLELHKSLAGYPTSLDGFLSIISAGDLVNKDELIEYAKSQLIPASLMSAGGLEPVKINPIAKEEKPLEAGEVEEIPELNLEGLVEVSDVEIPEETESQVEEKKSEPEASEQVESVQEEKLQETEPETEKQEQIKEEPEEVKPEEQKPEKETEKEVPKQQGAVAKVGEVEFGPDSTLQDILDEVILSEEPAKFKFGDKELTISYDGDKFEVEFDGVKASFESENKLATLFGNLEETKLDEIPSKLDDIKDHLGFVGEISGQKQESKEEKPPIEEVKEAVQEAKEKEKIKPLKAIAESNEISTKELNNILDEEDKKLIAYVFGLHDSPDVAVAVAKGISAAKLFGSEEAAKEYLKNNEDTKAFFVFPDYKNKGAKLIWKGQNGKIFEQEIGGNTIRPWSEITTYVGTNSIPTNSDEIVDDLAKDKNFKETFADVALSKAATKYENLKDLGKVFYALSYIKDDAPDFDPDWLILNGKGYYNPKDFVKAVEEVFNSQEIPEHTRKVLNELVLPRVKEQAFDAYEKISDKIDRTVKDQLTARGLYKPGETPSLANAIQVAYNDFASKKRPQKKKYKNELVSWVNRALSTIPEQYRDIALWRLANGISQKFGVPSDYFETGKNKATPESIAEGLLRVFEEKKAQAQEAPKEEKKKEKKQPKKAENAITKLNKLIENPETAGLDKLFKNIRKVTGKLSTEQLEAIAKHFGIDEQYEDFLKEEKAKGDEEYKLALQSAIEEFINEQTREKRKEIAKRNREEFLNSPERIVRFGQKDIVGKAREEIPKYLNFRADWFKKQRKVDLKGTFEKIKKRLEEKIIPRDEDIRKKLVEHSEAILGKKAKDFDTFLDYLARISIGLEPEEKEEESEKKETKKEVPKQEEKSIEEVLDTAPIRNFAPTIVDYLSSLKKVPKNIESTIFDWFKKNPDVAEEILMVNPEDEKALREEVSAFVESILDEVREKKSSSGKRGRKPKATAQKTPLKTKIKAATKEQIQEFARKLDKELLPMTFKEALKERGLSVEDLESGNFDEPKLNDIVDVINDYAGNTLGNLKFAAEEVFGLQEEEKEENAEEEKPKKKRGRPKKKKS